MKRLLCISVCAALAAGMSLFASGRGGELDANALITGHLGDSYWWHVTAIGDRDVTVYLPVIVRSRQTGWHVFSSRRLANGGGYLGFRIREDGKIIGRDGSGAEYRPWDISITKNALALMINSAVMAAIFLGAARWYRRRGERAVPRGFVGAVEMFVASVEQDVIKRSVGDDYKRYSPYLLTVFFFIFVNNIIGLVPFFPGGANVTGNIAITLVLATGTFIATNVFGNREYWREVLWPDVPPWLKAPVPLMPVIEIFGVLSKPFALMIRLLANILAGHTIMLALVCVIFITAGMGAGISAGMTVFAVILSVFMTLLEILVAYIQAYVFTLLSSIFIGLSRQKHHAVKTK